MAQSSMVDSNASISPEAGALLKKILNASSFSNIQTISFVPGIEVSGVDVGDSDISVTLKQIPSEVGEFEVECFDCRNRHCGKTPRK